MGSPAAQAWPLDGPQQRRLHLTAPVLAYAPGIAEYLLTAKLVDTTLTLSDGTTSCAIGLPVTVEPPAVSLWQRLRGKAPAPDAQPAIVRLTLRGPEAHVFALGASALRRLLSHFRRELDQLVPAGVADRDAELARWKKFRVEDLREVLS